MSAGTQPSPSGGPSPTSFGPLPGSTAGPGPVSKRRAAFLFGLRLFITLLTLGAVIRYAWNGRAVFAGQWAWDWKWLVAGALVAPLLLAGRAWKWWVLVRPMDAGITFRQAFRSYVGCQPLGLVTPGRVGEFSRGLWLPQKAAHGLAGAGRVFLDNWTDMSGVLFWAVLGWTLLAGAKGFLLGAAILLIFLPLRAWMRLLAGWSRFLPSRWGVRSAVLKALPDPRYLQPQGLWAAQAASVAIWGLEWLQFGFLLRFLGGATGAYWQVAGLLALATLANSVQVTLAGLGVREGVAAFLLARAGIALQASVPATLIQFALNLALPSLAGLAIKPPDWGALRRKPSPSPD